MFRKLITMLLALAIVLSLAACGGKPAETQPPTTATPTTEPLQTEAPELVAYRTAREALAQQPELVLQIRSKKTITVGGESFTESVHQILRCAGLDSDTPTFESHENVDYEGQYSVVYDELCTGGNLYVTVDEAHSFRGTITQEDAANRYAPPALLDETLYSEITAENSVISFSAPTAAESWAMPEGAQMQEASGQALLSAAGELQKTAYTITYSYGPAEITVDTEVYATAEPVSISLVDESAYTPLDYVDAPRLSEMTLGYFYNAENTATTVMESVMSQAAAVIRNQSTTVTTYGSGKDLAAKIETNVFLMDYSVNQEQRYEQEEIYQNGTYTLTVEGEDPQEAPLEASVIEEYCANYRGANMIAFDYWQNAAATDLGSVYLLELTLHEPFGADIEENICEMLFQDPTLLRSLASETSIKETTAYIGIDKYTGLPASAGYYCEINHTIQGQECLLSLQVDQSIEAPALGAYYHITDAQLPEPQPETPASPLLYHVTGQDGQEMWLFGTIHVGDSRTAYLPQKLYDALAASDALAVEFNATAFEDQMEEDEALQDAVSDAYYYSDGTQTKDHIAPELYEKAVPYLKATGNYNMNAEYMTSYLWSNLIDNFHLRQGYQLTSHQGLETRLEAFAEEHEIEIRDVESGIFQIQMTANFSDALQELLLEEALETDPVESWEGTMELYEAWCAGNEEELREMLSDEVDTAELTEEELAEYEEYKHLLEEYNKAMSYDRNDGMLEVAKEYLESGDTVFFAVGLAHLLNDVNGLVDTLREASYTVELVTYE